MLTHALEFCQRAGRRAGSAQPRGEGKAGHDHVHDHVHVNVDVDVVVHVLVVRLFVVSSCLCILAVFSYGFHGLCRR
jgi:hypothetical protein